MSRSQALETLDLWTFRELSCRPAWRAQAWQRALWPLVQWSSSVLAENRRLGDRGESDNREKKGRTHDDLLPVCRHPERSRPTLAASVAPVGGGGGTFKVPWLNRLGYQIVIPSEGEGFTALQAGMNFQQVHLTRYQSGWFMAQEGRGGEGGKVAVSGKRAHHHREIPCRNGTLLDRTLEPYELSTASENRALKTGR